MGNKRVGWSCAGLLLAACISASTARAEVGEVRISKGYGILYLPLIVMEDRKLLEKKAAEAGLGDLKVTWYLFDGGNIINDAMLAGTLDIAGTGAPGFLTLWSKGKGSPRTEVIGVSGMSTTALVLNTTNPDVKSLKDFSSKDRIAMPGIKTSLAAVVLQMAAAKEFGPENYAKLDPLTVGIPHPEAYAALTSGKTEIDAHFASPPYANLELKNPRVHTVINSVTLFGNITLDVVFAPKRFVEANPKTIGAFLAALDEACAFIADDPKATAEIFARSLKTKMSLEEVLPLVQDPDTRFSATPDGVMTFANFLASIGSIKQKPASWTGLFVPQLHGRKGS
ncbi:MAG: sulfonate transport system substrate-binding protein [Methylobacteriaceae bacterium]|jgi:NitT/TauT family transport system substrate-binding protein|nr:sulfonate transport system substrate-binding protein [Methylobacteriaceae bacterium]